MTKKAIIAIAIGPLLVAGIALFVLFNQRLPPGYYCVDKFEINGEDRVDELILKSITFHDDGSITFPFMVRNLKQSPGAKSGKWKSKKTGLNSEVIIIKDDSQKFSGEYEVEYIAHNPTYVVNLKSENISLTIIKPEPFSIYKTTMKGCN